MRYILAFGSPHKALKAESILKSSGVAFRLETGPKALSEYCDLVIAVGDDSIESALKSLGAAGTSAKAVYREENDEYVKV